MKDVTGLPLEVGMTVAITMPYYSELKVGKIIKVTPKGATIRREVARGGEVCTEDTPRLSHQIAVYGG